MILRDQQSGLILLVEDNRQIAEMAARSSNAGAIGLTMPPMGVTGLNLTPSNSYDVIVLACGRAGPGRIEGLLQAASGSQETVSRADAYGA